MILFRKMLRDMMENKLAYLACIIVMAIGLMAYSSMAIVMDNLQNAKDEFYRDYRMADAFAQVQSIPESSVGKLEKLMFRDPEGRERKLVEKAQGVFKQDYKVDFGTKDRNAYLKINSYDPKKMEQLNDVYLADGYRLNDEDLLIWVGQMFLEANELKAGDKLKLIIGGRSIELTIAGSVISPEYVYVTKNAQDIFPLPKNYDIAYMSETVLRKLDSAAGSYNHISFKLGAGVVFDDAKAPIESALQSHGLVSVFGVKDQVSNAILVQELDGVKSMSQSLPFLFLGISTFILYIMLKRLTETQRGQIGVLKAMGYSNWTIMLHYQGYAIFIGIIGGLFGGYLGTQLSFYFTDMYKDFFSFPTLRSDFTYKYFGIGILISLAFSIFAGYSGSRHILKLPPSTAMAPEAPKAAKRSRLERFPILWEALTLQGKMAVRNLSRSRGRSIFTVLGLLFAFSLMVVSWSYNTLIDVMIYNQYKYVELYDMKVGFKGIIDAREMKNTLYHIDGVEYVEGVVEVPVQLKRGTSEKSTMVVVLERDTRLYNLLDVSLKKIPIDREGLYLSENLADQMKVKEGDILRVESPVTEEHILMEIVSVFPQYLGSNGYINSKYLYEKTRLEDVATTAYLTVAPSKIREVRKQLEEAPRVGVVEVRSETLQKYEDLMDSYGYMSYVLALVSLLVGFAIVYNSSVISLSERQRELASMRVLGMKIEEVLSVVAFEQWVLGFVSMILGIPLALIMMQALKGAYQTDLYSMPTKLGEFAFLLSVLSSSLFIFLSQVNVKRRIKKFNIVEVLKERE